MDTIENDTLKWICFHDKCVWNEKLNNDICNNPRNSSGSCCLEFCTEFGSAKTKVESMTARITTFGRIRNTVDITTFDKIENVTDIEKMLFDVLPNSDETDHTVIKKMDVVFSK